jgi:hypothetical protein
LLGGQEVKATSPKQDELGDTKRAHSADWPLSRIHRALACYRKFDAGLLKEIAKGAVDMFEATPFDVRHMVLDHGDINDSFVGCGVIYRVHCVLARGADVQLERSPSIRTSFCSERVIVTLVKSRTCSRTFGLYLSSSLKDCCLLYSSSQHLDSYCHKEAARSMIIIQDNFTILDFNSQQRGKCVRTYNDSTFVYLPTPWSRGRQRRRYTKTRLHSRRITKSMYDHL